MPRKKGADEIFCRSCGVAIKKEATLCPECGTRNAVADLEATSATRSQQERSETSGTTAANGRGATTTERAQQSMNANTSNSVETTPSQKPSTSSWDVREVIDRVAPYAAWVGGIFMVLMGLAVLADGGGILWRLLSTSVFWAAGLFALPPVRDQLRSELRQYNIPLSRGAIISVFIVALFAGSLLAPT